MMLYLHRDIFPPVGIFQRDDLTLRTDHIQVHPRLVDGFGFGPEMKKKREYGYQYTTVCDDRIPKQELPYVVIDFHVMQIFC
jgi:hypothetical protein